MIQTRVTKGARKGLIGKAGYKPVQDQQIPLTYIQGLSAR